MPIYEYACTECGNRLDVRQSFTDDALTVCPECSGRLRKLLSPVGVVFKGSGFYRNDSRSGSGSEGGSDGASGDSKSGESKESAPKSPGVDNPAAKKAAPEAVGGGKAKRSAGSGGSSARSSGPVSSAGAGSKAAR